MILSWIILSKLEQWSKDEGEMQGKLKTPVKPHGEIDKHDFTVRRREVTYQWAVFGNLTITINS